MQIAAGNIYAEVANGDFDAPGGERDYGDSALRLQLSGSSFTVLDYFTPFDQQTLDDLDLDLGSGGVVLLPDQPSSPNHLLLANNKGGRKALPDQPRQHGKIPRVRRQPDPANA